MIKGKVVSIDKEEMLDGQKLQTLSVDTGDGKTVKTFNDYKNLKAGDKVFLDKIDGGNFEYQVVEIDRTTPIFLLAALFIFVLVLFGRKQGVRGLISLVFSLFLIVQFLIPGILAGQSPILLSLLITLIIVTIGSFVTHGFNRTTISATIGMGITLIFTSVLTYFSVKIFELTGMDSEESYYLLANAAMPIDLSGVLLGGILIGILGVLYDAAIGQAVAVEELWRASKNATNVHIYRRAERMGREHIGALVNTLAIAYVGVSLPLLLLIYTINDAPLSFLLSREMFATEIVRTLVGSIGLILTVPITTIISVILLKNLAGKDAHDIINSYENHHKITRS
jgi:uncharacterized membrane protein